MTAARPLRDRTLAHHAARVRVPTYDRRRLEPSVVHLSVGSFHRSHQAVYFDDLAERRISTSWGVVGTGRRRTMRDALAAQDGLFTVIVRGTDADLPRVIGVERSYLYVGEQREDILAALSAPWTRLVTLTVTPGAYGEEALAPDSAIRVLVEGLARRRRARLRPFTVLACDNLAENGVMARRAMCAVASFYDPALARWIEDEVACPSSMVDRITPQTTDEDRRGLARAFGVLDRSPVVTEPFSQWVVEDHFCNDRPPLEEVGVQFVCDVRPHALLKTRLLNASHCALGYIGTLAGHTGTSEALADPLVSAAIEHMTGDEIAPLLPPVAGMDVHDYRRTVLLRLRNEAIDDQLDRLCRNGSSKVPAHILSSIGEARALRAPHAVLTLAVAAWCKHLREDGPSARIDDPLADRLRALARAGGSDPRPLLGEAAIFGALSDEPGFAEDVERALSVLDRDGAHAAIMAALSGGRHELPA